MDCLCLFSRHQNRTAPMPAQNRDNVFSFWTTWEFRINAEVAYRDLTPRFCTNDGESETQAVLDGLGIGQLGSFTAAEYIRSGRLIPLLVQHVTDHEGIYMYYGHRTELPLRVRTFIDFMVTHLAGNRRFFLKPAELRALLHRE